MEYNVGASQVRFEIDCCETIRRTSPVAAVEYIARFALHYKETICLPITNA